MKIIDTKIIINRNGNICHLSRERKGLWDHITITYPSCDMLKTIRKQVLSLYGWCYQIGCEKAIDTGL